VEIPSKEIGLIVLEKLKNIDPVAYIRFATIYMNIKKIEEFEQLVKKFKVYQKKK